MTLRQITIHSDRVEPGHLDANADEKDTIQWVNKSGEQATVYLPPHRFIVHQQSTLVIDPGESSEEFRVGRRPEDRGYHHYGVRLGKRWLEGDSEPAVIVGP